MMDIYDLVACFFFSDCLFLEKKNTESLEKQQNNDITAGTMSICSKIIELKSRSQLLTNFFRYTVRNGL